MATETRYNRSDEWNERILVSYVKTLTRGKPLSTRHITKCVPTSGAGPSTADGGLQDDALGGAPSDPSGRRYVGQDCLSHRREEGRRPRPAAGGQTPAETCGAERSWGVAGWALGDRPLAGDLRGEPTRLGGLFQRTRGQRDDSPDDRAGGQRWGQRAGERSG